MYIVMFRSAKDSFFTAAYPKTLRELSLMLKFLRDRWEHVEYRNYP